MRAFRTVIILLILILLLPVWPLLSRTSSTADAVLGRYTVRYFLILLAYTSLLIGLVVVAIMARPAWADLIQKIMRPVHRLWFVVVLVGLALFHGWYMVREVLSRTIYFGTIESPTYRLMLIFSALFIVYVVGVLLLAGREPDNLKQVAGNILMLAFGLWLGFVVFSFGYAWVLNGEAYRQAHTVWSATRRDSLLGTMTRSNLDRHGMYLPDEQRMVPVSTNSEGFRGPDTDVERPIAVIGDSFTFGFFSDDDYLWSNTLSEMLGVPVANYGIWGIDLNRYVLIAENYIEPGEHDLVIYAVYANDLSARAEPGASLDMYRLRAPLRATRSPISYTYAQVFVRQSPFDLLFGPRPEVESHEPTAHGYLDPCLPPGMAADYSESARKTVEEYVDLMVELAEAGDYQVGLVLIPTNVSVYPDELLPVCGPEYETYLANEERGYDDLCAYAAEKGITCFDTTDAFREAADRPEPLFLPVDTHWNELGNDVFAGILADYLQSEDLIP